MTAHLEVAGLTKTYRSGAQEVAALKNVSFKVSQGEFVSIMGPSGSGKSTLLHLIGGLDKATSGNVILSGQSIKDFNDNDLSRFRRLRLGFIFQFFNLVPTLSALENVALPLLLDGKKISEVQPKALELLEFMGLGSRVTHRPDQLSGGEMQRVAIARALVSDPWLILADEPTGNLDTKTGATVLKLLSELSNKRKQTILMVTHDPNAASYGTRVLNMRDGYLESDRMRSVESPLNDTQPI